MSRHASLDALKERALRLGPDAMGVLESIIRGDGVKYTCEECGHKGEARFSRLQKDAALDMLKMAGAGPVDRRQVEEAPPATQEERLKMLMENLKLLPPGERMQLAKALAGSSTLPLLEGEQ